MLDLPHLRATYPVILSSEFYELHGLDPSLESLAGDWNRGEENITVPSIHAIPNQDYDPPNVIRVDTLQGLPIADKVDSKVDELLKSALGDASVLHWDDAVQALQNGNWKLEKDADLMNVMKSGGWVVAYTFLGA